MSDPSDQCALDASGNLKPAVKIDFYFDKDDDAPMSGPNVASKSNACSRQSNTGGRMKELLDAEMHDEDGQPTAPTNPCHRRKKAKKNGKKNKQSGEYSGGTTSDADDGDFSTETLAGILASKTVPATIKRRRVVVEDVEDEESTTNTASSSKKACRYIIEDDSEDGDEGDPASQASRQTGPAKRKRRVGKWNPIYYFYESVPLNSDGKPGNLGNKHFKCYHGNWKVTYRALEDLFCSDVSSKKLDLQVADIYLKQMESESKNIIHAFKKQSVDVKGEWDQQKFETLLAEWIIVCDQLLKRWIGRNFVIFFLMLITTRLRICTYPTKMPFDAEL
ncbi:hypothetical protein ARMSODRAFT_979585 [Armillaria solidipes]|uniref:Uncharacterized protein n=1 Tax=Armillaria solidipes TaxID=1076256 RepID=A0A2H3BHD7_9AGAR|nr:hypothetical protein ARMSODRAFT_979585 [Armillaria solidipes]